MNVPLTQIYKKNSSLRRWRKAGCLRLLDCRRLSAASHSVSGDHLTTVGVDCLTKMSAGKCRRQMVPAYVGRGGSVPVGVGARYEHSRMADGENVYLVADDFVHDAIGTAEGLAEFVGVRRDRVEAFNRNAIAGEGMIFECQDGALNVVVPAQGVCNGLCVGNGINNVIQETLGMRREIGFHTCSRCRARSRSRILSKTSLVGMPLPSANSRREILTSRERLTRSRYDWHCETISSCCSYSAMFMTTVVARPFCVMNRGRCVRFVRSRQSLKVRRYSVKGMTSSLIFGRGKVFSTNGIAVSPINVANSVPNSVPKSNAQESFKEVA